MKVEGKDVYLAWWRGTYRKSQSVLYLSTGKEERKLCRETQRLAWNVTQTLLLNSVASISQTRTWLTFKSEQMLKKHVQRGLRVSNCRLFYYARLKLSSGIVCMTAGEEDHLLCFQDWEQTSFSELRFFHSSQLKLRVRKGISVKSLVLKAKGGQKWRAPTDHLSLWL